MKSGSCRKVEYSTGLVPQGRKILGKSVVILLNAPMFMFKWNLVFPGKEVILLSKFLPIKVTNILIMYKANGF